MSDTGVSPPTVIINGTRGAGKSTLVTNLCTRFQPHVGGVISQSVGTADRPDSVRAGIDVVLIPETERIALAVVVDPNRVDPNRPAPTYPLVRGDLSRLSGERTSDYGPFRFSCDAIDIVNRHLSSIADGMKSAVDLVVIDEIGPIELERGGGFLPGALSVLASTLPTVISVRTSLAREITELANAAGRRVDLIALEGDTREETMDSVVAILKRRGVV
mgnify:CR=1 FL=1